MSTSVASPGRNIPSLVLWALVGALGVFALVNLATARGESVNAIWLVSAATCVYLIAYRFYSLFIAQRVLRLDPSRATPAQCSQRLLNRCTALPRPLRALPIPVGSPLPPPISHC